MRRIVILLLAALGLVTCVEPTPPEYQLEQAFYLIEGEIVDRPDLSEVRISASNFQQVQLEFSPVAGATVVATEEGAGTQVQWELADSSAGLYRPPLGFAARAGETWGLEVSLPDGTVAVSRAEVVPGSVPIDDFRIVFDQEGDYDAELKRFVPVFRLFLDFTDPAGEDNYYQWNFRYWQSAVVCLSCNCGVYRNGECVPAQRCNGNNERYDYFCEVGTDGCFRIVRGDELTYASDRAFAGGTVKGQPVGTIDFLEFGPILVEAQQYTLTREGYDYGKVISDLIGGNRGLNATIPAALNGNVRNLDPDGATVLGNVRAASVSSQRQFFVRDASTGDPLPGDRSIRPEPSSGPFTPPLAPCDGPDRTLIKPEGWID